MPTPRLSLRDLFAIVTLAAVLVAWWLDHRQLSRSRDAIDENLTQATVEAAISRQQWETTEELLQAMIRKVAPERIGTDFEFSIDADGVEVASRRESAVGAAAARDEGTTHGAQDQPTATRLYTDSEVEQVVEHWTARNVEDEALLRVVPSGTAAPLVTVFGALGFDLARLWKLEEWAANHVVFLKWQVSPSYRLVCMTAINDPDNKGIGYTDRRRRLYGIRIDKHAKETNGSEGNNRSELFVK